MNTSTHDLEPADFLARATNDSAFRRALSADPASALRDAGFTVPEGISVRVFENTDSRVHLVIPSASSVLSDEELDQVAGGGKAWDRIKSVLNSMLDTKVPFDHDRP